MIKVFISHSAKDAGLAGALAELLRVALALSAREIRCTSVDGYRLPGGSDTTEQLRAEVIDTEAFLGLMTANSLQSAYVSFELGARWGARRHLVPILGPGLRARVLDGPLAGLNALRCDDRAQLGQLLEELAATLEVELEPIASYQRYLDGVLGFGPQSSPPSENGQEHEPTLADNTATADPEPTSSRAEVRGDAHLFAGAESIIKRRCEEEWGTEYDMRVHCEEEEREALRKLLRAKPADIPDHVFSDIRSRCAREWPEEFGMRLHCEEEKIIAYRKLKAGS